MWPQLLALIPHLTRLVPAVDRYLQSRANSERSNEETLNALSEGLRSDMGRISTAHASLNTQLQNQAHQLTQIAEDLRRVRASHESAQIRADALELQVTSLNLRLKIIGIFSIVLLLVLIVLVGKLVLSGH